MCGVARRGLCGAWGPSTFADELGLHVTPLPRLEGGGDGADGGADHFRVPAERQGLRQVQEPAPHCRRAPCDPWDSCQGCRAGDSPRLPHVRSPLGGLPSAPTPKPLGPTHPDATRDPSGNKALVPLTRRQRAQDPRRRHRPCLTIANPASCRVLGGKQLELGLQGPGLHGGAVQPLQGLHEHFEEARREAGVLGHAALGTAQHGSDRAGRGRPACHSGGPSSARPRSPRGVCCRPSPRGAERKRSRR